MALLFRFLPYRLPRRRGMTAKIKDKSGRDSGQITG
jgi:hypothetical protein